jgi:RimJ/RimL family protein N-acetyltransferase
VVGRTGFRALSLETGSASAGYWTAPAARGCDVAARALRAASTWMLTNGGLHRLELNHSVANLASCRVAAKAGYAYEGTRRRQGLHQDGWHDMHVHGLLEDDLGGQSSSAAAKAGSVGSSSFLALMTNTPTTNAANSSTAPQKNDTW